jgi:osmotically inducible protein OsmC
LVEGKGQVTLDSSGIGTYDVSWGARTEEPGGTTSPEELIAAAHASCFSMALALALTEAGLPADSLESRAEVDFTPGAGITSVRLFVSGDVPGMDKTTFADVAKSAKENCPVSQALKAVPIDLTVE